MSSGERHTSGERGGGVCIHTGRLAHASMIYERKLAEKKAAGQHAVNVIQTRWQITCCFYNGGNNSQGVFFYRVEWILCREGGGGCEKKSCDKGGGVESDVRGEGFILQWQQGAPRGPLKAASGITSGSFSHWIPAPVEGIIFPVSVCRPRSSGICY